MKVVLFEAEDWEKKACATLMRQHDVRRTTVPPNFTTVDDFEDAEVISPFVASRLDVGIIDPIARFEAHSYRSPTTFSCDFRMFSLHRTMPTTPTLRSVAS